MYHIKSYISEDELKNILIKIYNKPIFFHFNLMCIIAYYILYFLFILYYLLNLCFFHFIDYYKVLLFYSLIIVLSSILLSYFFGIIFNLSWTFYSIFNNLLLHISLLFQFFHSSFTGNEDWGLFNSLFFLSLILL